MFKLIYYFYQDVINSIGDVGSALEMVNESTLIRSKLLSRIKYARDIASQSHKAGKKRARVAFFEWTSPIYLGGHWTPQIIRWSNASNFKTFLINLSVILTFIFLSLKGVQILNDCKDGETAEIGAPPSYVNKTSLLFIWNGSNQEHLYLMFCT